MSLVQDLRFALRMVVKDRWFTAVAVAALALGIGVNATVFTLVNAVLIRGLPFPDSEQLFMLGLRRPVDTRGRSLSFPELQDFRSQSRTLTLAGFSRNNVNIADDHGFPEQVQATYLTANAFQVLRQQPLLGRDFAPSEDRVGAERVVILGYSLWKNRYGAERDAIGRVLRVNGESATIVGVMPDGMMFPTDSAMWMPFIPNTEQQQKRSARPLEIFGRVRDRASRAEAQTELDGIAARLATQYPDTNKELTAASVQTFNERFNGGEIRQVFLAMMGAVGFVLLIACANVANLLLSRSAHRAREVAVRVALGASRWRVVRQLLVESVVLGFMGGVLGLLLAVVGVRLFDAAVADSGKPYWIQFTMDWVVFGFLAAICIVTGVLFGLAPALQVSRTNVNEVLKEGGRGNAGNRRTGWMTSTMVVVELTLTIVLLVGAGLMTRSFLKLYSLDLGVRTDHLMGMNLRLPNTKYPTEESRRGFYDRVLPRLAAIAGVDGVAITTSLPSNGGWRGPFEVEGRPIANDNDRPTTLRVTVSPTFFETLGAPIVRGRGFTPNDGAAGSENVIINQRFATEFFPGDDPIGRRIRFPAGTGQPPATWLTIIGISSTIQHIPPRDTSAPRGVVYMSLRQDATGFAQVAIRSRLEPGVVMGAVRREVQAVDPDQPVFTVQTMDQLLARQRWPYRVFGTLFAIFAIIALVLSSVGLYAVMAYSVTQRTPEIGVRMALGAGHGQVRWLILRRGLVQLAIGLVLGLGGAFLMSKAVQPLLFQVTPTDPGTFVGISLLLTVVSVAACLIPARRATRLDPLTALRID
jgi:putative ABC transport system permease protein